MNDMRDRLIALIKSPHKAERLRQRGYDIGQYEEDCIEAMLADFLLANGVIVLPCKVGQWVYVPWRYIGQSGITTVRIEEIKFYDSNMHYMFFIDMESDDECFNQSFGGWKIGDSIGETVFLTKQEAEKALKESEGE